MSAAGLQPETLAYVALRADSGEVVASRSPTRPMQPASSIKLLTAAVALDRLGLAWRSRSELVTDGELNGSVLRGNVLLRGYGDSDLDAEALRRMLQKLRHSGVREITGDVVMVRNWFFMDERVNTDQLAVVNASLSSAAAAPRSRGSSSPCLRSPRSSSAGT